MAWLYLVLAGLLEVVWSFALKQSDGLSRPGLTASPRARGALLVEAPPPKSGAADDEGQNNLREARDIFRAFFARSFPAAA